MLALLAYAFVGVAVVPGQPPITLPTKRFPDQASCEVARISLQAQMPGIQTTPCAYVRSRR